ncbi:MAG: DUF3122 domain-containing protein [Spirulinaceae cyanobacterium SM2_1_0]|nr:DUF3122 domain-containing protein [Spirulinaceae cyanobacterium SM2_1_0]
MTAWQRALALCLAVMMAIAGWYSRTLPAQAAIRVTEEAPGQFLYQTRHSLRDDSGQPWQVVFFKRQRPERAPLVHLRLVGFPTVTTFEHPQPLPIWVDSEPVAMADDVFGARSPSPNVGEYDFATRLADLPAVSFLQLQLPLTEPRSLRIPYFVVQQWRAVAARDAAAAP